MTPKVEWNPEAINPDDAPRAVQEYLQTLDDDAFGAASPVTPKFISHSDPTSQWTGARGGRLCNQAKLFPSALTGNVLRRLHRDSRYRHYEPQL